MLLVSAYHGPPELTPLRALTEWAVDPWALTIAVVTALCYLTGVLQVRKRGITWPPARTVAFLAGGPATAVIATCSFIGAYWPVLFWVRAVQTVLLLLVVPLFLALGRPLTLTIAAAQRVGARIEAAVSGRVARAVTFPAVTALVLILTPILLYFTAWYQAGLHSLAVRELTGLALIVPGLLFFWTLLRVDPVPRAYPYLVALWVTGVEVVGDAVLGIAVITDHTLIAGAYYQALARPWGPSLRTDQVLGGGALWILGDLVGLPFLAAVLVAMIREDAAEAREVDAALDAEQAVQTADPSESAGRPWWVSDPRFAARFAPVSTDDARRRPSRRTRRAR